MNSQKNKIKQNFLEVQKEFPFGNNYIDCNLKRYTAIISEIMNDYPSGSKILSIGSGPCELEAVLSKLGYVVTAIDDLNDQWHLIGKNMERIKDFAKRMNIKLIIESSGESEIKKNSFDVVLLIDFIEQLLNYSISLLKSNGIIIIESPNTVSLIKRLKVLFGKTNQFNSEFIYWWIGEYRGHIREYTQSELKLILYNQNLKQVNLKMLDIYNIDTKEKCFLRKLIDKVLKMISGFYPNFRDTILISGKKPVNWNPTEPSLKNFKKYYTYIEKCNLDNETDELIIKKIAERQG